MEPTILTLHWQDGTQPSDLPNFESKARRLRYQALGRACQQHGVQSLLLAHHADDQAETILVRLARGLGATGLRGIRPSAEIPECWGISGVHQSGKALVINRGGDDCLKHADRFYTTGLDKKPMPIERGGIVVCRPLLQFKKKELIATCQSNGVQWVEDETNQDPTKTVRNAARKLLSSKSLPRALCAQPLLVLAHKIQHQIEQRTKFAARLLRATYIQKLDLRSATMSIQVPAPPPHICWHNSTTHSLSNRNKAHYQYEVSMTLRRLIEVVSPWENIPLSSVKTAAEIVSGHKEAPRGFTAAGVMFVRSKEKRPCDHAHNIWTRWNMKADAKARGVARAAFTSSPAYVWTLTREPYHSTEALPIIRVEIPSPVVSAHGPSLPPQTSHLWDGRFWIKVNNRTGSPLCIRPFSIADLRPFYEALEFPEQRPFDDLLRSAAWGGSRWTLPVIAFADDVVLEDIDSRVLALPSLGVVLKQWEGKISWYIRYKHVDLDTHVRSMRWI